MPSITAPLRNPWRTAAQPAGLPRARAFTAPVDCCRMPSIRTPSGGPPISTADILLAADFVVELPVGRGKPLLGSAKGWVNQIVGGWQASGPRCFPSHTGTPLTVIDTGTHYNVNYDNSAFGMLAPGAKLPANGLTFDSNGIPSIFANPNSCEVPLVGAGPWTGGNARHGAGDRPSFGNTDLAVSKTFMLPWEQQQDTPSAPRRSTPSTTWSSAYRT